MDFKLEGYDRNKYIIQKADGSSVDPEADYFVLRLDKDPHARVALLHYARSVRSDNERLYNDIMRMLSSGYKQDVKEIGSDNYVKHVLRTEPKNLDVVRERLVEERVIKLLHGVLGLVTESAELADMLKKHIFYGRPLDYRNAKEELGDNLWYVGLCVDVLNTTIDDIMTLNIEKLRKRYPEKFTEHFALNRNVVNEMTHFIDNPPLYTKLEGTDTYLYLNDLRTAYVEKNNAFTVGFAVETDGSIVVFSGVEIDGLKLIPVSKEEFES